MATCFQWNCRGYLSNYEDCLRLLQERHVRIAALQELQLCFRPFPRPPGFFDPVISVNRGPHDRGGAALLLHDSLSFSIISLKTRLHASAVRIHAPCPFTVCSLYLAPSCPYEKRDLVELFRQLPSPRLILGDLNLRHPLWGDSIVSPRSPWILDLMETFELGCLNDGSPTFERLHPPLSSCPDVSLCSLALFDKFSWDRLPFLFGSDHYPLVLSSSAASAPCLPPVPRWNYHRADWSSFSCSLQDITFPDVTSFSSTSEAYDFFRATLFDVAALHIPLSGCGSRPPNPWWSAECRHARSLRESAYRAYKRDPSVTNLILYKVERARARRVCRSARRSCFRAFISRFTSSTPMSVVFRTVKRMSRKNPTSPPISLKYGPDVDDVLTHPVLVADELGSHFARCSSSVGYSPAFRARRASSRPPDFRTREADGLSYNCSFSFAELFVALKQCKDGAPGPDGVTYQMLRHSPEAVLLFLLDLFNEIWVRGLLPSVWKEATVVPLAKPGKDPHLVASYRPIALTSQVGKLMERMVANRLVPVLESSDFLSPFQFGFRRLLSTSVPLLKFDYDIREAFAAKDRVLAVSFDLERAYDSAWRRGILLQLHRLGFRGSLPLFLSDLLDGRSIRVRVGGAFSRPFEIEEGVPQGGVLSVFLFLLAINPISEVIPSSISYMLYADDLLIYLRGRRLPSLCRAIQLCINRIAEWADSVGFRFSASKTNCILFSKRKIRNGEEDLSVSLSLGGTPIPLRPHIRLLGVHFDGRLSYRHHITLLKASCSRILDVISLVAGRSWGADRRVLLRLCQTLVTSKLDYGCVLYGQASEARLKLLDPVQNRALRLATGAFRSSPKVSLEVEANVMPLSLRRLSSMCRFSVRLQASPSPVAGDLVGRVVANPPFWPFAGMVSACIDSFDLTDVPVGRFSFQKLADWWTFPLCQVCDFRLPDGKSSYNTCQLRQMVLAHCSRHADRLSFYTDGSKCSEGVGAAVFSTLFKIGIRLPRYASSFTAELVAILIVLQRLLSSDFSRFVIYCDSWSALQALRDPFPVNVVVLEIQRFLRLLHSRHKDLLFCWQPSHVGVAGNEGADGLAKWAAGASAAGPDCIFVDLRDFNLPFSDVLAFVKQGIRALWQESWTASPRGLHLKTIKPVLGEWPSCYLSNRFLEVVLARLRIGHTNFSHSHLMSRSLVLSCRFCSDDAPLSVRHVLLECRALSLSRRRFFPSLGSPPGVDDYRFMLADSTTFSPSPLFGFMSSVRLLYKV